MVIEKSATAPRTAGAELLGVRTQGFCSRSGGSPAAGSSTAVPALAHLHTPALLPPKMSGSDSDDDFAISGGAAAAPAPAAAADDDEVAAADEPADEPEPETTAASVLGAAFSLFAPKPTAPPAQEAKRESITAASISITEPEPASTAEPADSAPELPAKVTEEDLTELNGRAAAAEPTARVLNALLAKVDAMGTKIEALEAENRSLKAGLVPLIKSVAAAPQDASEGVPGEVPEAAGMRPRFVAAAGLSPAEEIAGRRLFDEADQVRASYVLTCVFRSVSAAASFACDRGRQCFAIL